MTALSEAAKFCGTLTQHRISYSLYIIRADALMITVAIPGERWEIEFFDDDHVELERFVSEGVTDAPEVLTMLLERLDDD